MCGVSWTSIVSLVFFIANTNKSMNQNLSHFKLRAFVHVIALISYKSLHNLNHSNIVKMLLELQSEGYMSWGLPVYLSIDNYWYNNIETGIFTDKVRFQMQYGFLKVFALLPKRLWGLFQFFISAMLSTTDKPSKTAAR